MSSIQKLLSATALAMALVGSLAAATPALATEGHGGLMFVTPKGEVMHMAMDAMSADKQAMLMKHAHKLPAGSIVYTTDSGIWVADDAKMDNGKMLSDALMH